MIRIPPYDDDGADTDAAAERVTEPWSDTTAEMRPVVSLSLITYLAGRTHDIEGALRALTAALPPAGLWMTVVGHVAELAGLAPCRFDAVLLLRQEDGRLSAIIIAKTWSVTLFRSNAWVDVEWPSETLAIALHGKPVRSQIDFPFLSATLVVRDHAPYGSCVRFHCYDEAERI